jgi:hypothetical protein
MQNPHLLPMESKRKTWLWAFALLPFIMAWQPVTPQANPQVYGILYYDAYYFYIAEPLTGEIENIDYMCIPQVSAICTILSQMSPDPWGRIPRPFASVLCYGGSFTDLNPFH